MPADSEVTQPEVNFAYQPALDGVRGVAVAMVLLFHAGFGWMSGGYLGVSVFFTLSGFLITSLALREHANTGRLGIGAFYARRIRRLLPASMVCLLGVSVLAMVGVFDDVANLRRGLWGALAQVYNWVALAGGDSYEELVSAAAGTVSPLDHYWSLSIEEQFYWLWPVALAVVLARLATSRLRSILFIGLAVAAGVAAPVIAAIWGADAAYWATPARLGEILVGAALAVAVGGDPGRRLLGHRSVPFLGLAGLAVILVTGATWPSGGGPAYSGWLPAFALASAALIAGLQLDSPLRRAMSLRPLVALGAISYGVYLFHWPVYTVIHPGRVDLSRVPLFLLRLAVTLAISTMSYVFVERPIRRGRRLPFAPVGTTALAGCAAMALFIAVAVPSGRGAYWEASEEVQAEMRAAVGLDPVDASIPPLDTRGTVSAGGAAAASTGRLNRPLRVLVFGDSTASALGIGLTAWANDHRETVAVSVKWAPGCDVLRLGELVDDLGQYEDDCVTLHRQLPDQIRRLRPDVLVVMTTTNDIADRRLEEDASPTGPGDAGFDEVAQRGFRKFLDGVAKAGVAKVAWIKPPVPMPYDVQPTEDMIARISWLWEMEDEVAAERPQSLQVIDLAGWVDRQPDTVRPDGLHVSPEAGYRFAGEMMVPMLIDEVVS